MDATNFTASQLAQGAFLVVILLSLYMDIPLFRSLASSSVAKAIWIAVIAFVSLHDATLALLMTVFFIIVLVQSNESSSPIPAQSSPQKQEVLLRSPPLKEVSFAQPMDISANEVMALQEQPIKEEEVKERIDSAKGLDKRIESLITVPSDRLRNIQTNALVKELEDPEDAEEGFSFVGDVNQDMLLL